MAQPTPMRHTIDFARYQKALQAAPDDKTLFDTIVNLPFSDKVTTTLMGLGIIVLLLVNKKTGMIDRVALSNNEQAEDTKRMSVKQFEDIKIPVGYPTNIIARAIESGQPQSTTDWHFLFAPELTPEEARLNQAGGAIAVSYVYPLDARDGGAMIFSYNTYPSEIGKIQLNFMQRYSQLTAGTLAG